MEASSGRIILDGGMGHELKLRGVSDGTFLAGVLVNEYCANDNVVSSIHGDYLATCDIITTNSFVAVPQRMIECGLATDEAHSNTRASELIRASVNRARAAISKHNAEMGETRRKKRIAGCVPPLTECYISSKVPSSTENLLSEYTVILTTLLECKVDILLAETLSTSREALAILRALSGIHNMGDHQIPPLWISFTIHDDGPIKLRSNESLETTCQCVIQEAESLNIPLKAVGINCSAPSAISNAVPIIAKQTEGTGIKVLAYGNCFRTSTSEWMRSCDDEKGVNTCTKKMMQAIVCTDDYDDEGYLTPESYAGYCIEWSKSGAMIIGGCCGSRPNHMACVNSAFYPSYQPTSTKLVCPI